MRCSKMLGLMWATRCLAVAIVTVASGQVARAQEEGKGAGQTPAPAGLTPETTGTQAEPVTNATPSIQSSLGNYGDPGGIRAFLHGKGIDYNFTYIGEVFGNFSGGVKQGATFEGRLDADFDFNTEKLFGLTNGAIHAQFFQIHGRGLSGNNVQDLFITSNIEAYPDTKLYEVWYEHTLLDGKLFIRAGQLGADSEFFISQTATLFINSTFGWPASASDNLPSSGASYPVAAPGVRIKALPTDNLTMLVAVFDGDPAGPFNPGINSSLYQQRDPGGLNFRVQDPPLAIGEVQYAYNQEKDAKGLPGMIKLGYLHHFEAFAPAFAGSALETQPVGTAAPGYSPATPYVGNNGIYGVIDQTIYREPGTDDQGASVFLRGSYFPGDRNLIDLYLDGGVTYKGLIPKRDTDTAGVSFAYSRISPNVSAADIVDGSPLVRDYQAVIEATYQIAILPGFTVQPDAQYVFHPGAHGVAIPGTNQPIHDAAVFGLRATVHY